MLLLPAFAAGRGLVQVLTILFVSAALSFLSLPLVQRFFKWFWEQLCKLWWFAQYAGVLLAWGLVLFWLFDKYPWLLDRLQEAFGAVYATASKAAAVQAMNVWKWWWDIA